MNFELFVVAKPWLHARQQNTTNPFCTVLGIHYPVQGMERFCPSDPGTACCQSLPHVLFCQLFRPILARQQKFTVNMKSRYHTKGTKKTVRFRRRLGKWAKNVRLKNLLVTKNLENGVVLFSSLPSFVGLETAVLYVEKGDTWCRDKNNIPYLLLDSHNWREQAVCLPLRSFLTLD